jgi:hypothetical protein
MSAIPVRAYYRVMEQGLSRDNERDTKHVIYKYYTTRTKSKSKIMLIYYYFEGQISYKLGKFYATTDAMPDMVI